MPGVAAGAEPEAETACHWRVHSTGLEQAERLAEHALAEHAGASFVPVAHSVAAEAAAVAAAAAAAAVAAAAAAETRPGLLGEDAEPQNGCFQRLVRFFGLVVRSLPPSS